MTSESSNEKARRITTRPDPVTYPTHYTAHPSGVECIQITEHMNFNLGNAMKYIWRADEKGAAIEDLKKAAWYITREIERREKPVREKVARYLHSKTSRPIPAPPAVQKTE